jgi:putative hemolysin
LAVGLVVVLVTYFSLVVGKLLPKRIGMTNPEVIALLVARLPARDRGHGR